jgi:hypothetical protein
VSENIITHKCEGELPSDGYGEAIDSCYGNVKGEYWVGNSEYGSQVKYCPYCGTMAPSQPTVRAAVLGDRL